MPFHENTSLRPQKQHRYFIHPKVLDSCHLSDLFLNLSPEYFVFSIYCFQRVAPTVNLNPRAIQFSSNLKNAVCIIMPRTVHQIFIVYFLHLQQCLKTKSIMGPMTRWVDVFNHDFVIFLKENQLYSERNVSTPQHKIIELIFSYLGSKSGIMGIYPPHGSYTLAVRAKSTLHINMNLRKNYVCHLRTCFAVLRFDIVNRIIFILFFAQLLPKRKISLRSFSLKEVPGSIVEICKG